MPTFHIYWSRYEIPFLVQKWKTKYRWSSLNHNWDQQLFHKMKNHLTTYNLWWKLAQFHLQSLSKSQLVNKTSHGHNLRLPADFSIDCSSETTGECCKWQPLGCQTMCLCKFILVAKCSNHNHMIGSMLWQLHLQGPVVNLLIQHCCNSETWTNSQYVRVICICSIQDLSYTI